LDGGGGKDTYVFKDPAVFGVDTIVTFKSGEKIQVDHRDFGGLITGKLAYDQFVVGTAAKDGNDHFIYDPVSGGLFHDADGAGGLTQTQFAQMQANLANFSADSIIVI
jgi:Ca2+-binding RTX toxin-like protein